MSTHKLVLEGKIVVAQRTHDWMAYEVESAGQWESGPTEEAAIEELLKNRTHLREMLHENDLPREEAGQLHFNGLLEEE